MGKVVHRRPDGTLLVEIAPDEAGDLDVGAYVDVRRSDGVIETWPEALDASAGEFPAITPADIAAFRSAAWSGTSR